MISYGCQTPGGNLSRSPDALGSIATADSNTKSLGAEVGGGGQHATVAGNLHETTGSEDDHDSNGY